MLEMMMKEVKVYEDMFNKIEIEFTQGKINEVEQKLSNRNGITRKNNLSLRDFKKLYKKCD